MAATRHRRLERARERQPFEHRALRRGDRERGPLIQEGGEGHGG